jgi:hypothetical protein
MYSLVCLGLCRASSLVLSGEGYHDEDGRAVQAAFRWRAVGTMAHLIIPADNPRPKRHRDAISFQLFRIFLELRGCNFSFLVGGSYAIHTESTLKRLVSWRLITLTDMLGLRMHASAMASRGVSRKWIRIRSMTPRENK